MLFLTCYRQTFQIGSHRNRMVGRLLAMIVLAWLSNVCMGLAQELKSAADLETLPAASLISVDGKPAGVGQIELPLSLAIKNGWHADQSIDVESADCKIWMVAISTETASKADHGLDLGDAGRDHDLLRILFLYSGPNPSTVELHIAGKAGLTIGSAVPNVAHSVLLRRWWDAMHNQPSGISPALQQLTDNILLSLGKHLGMPPKPQSASPNDGSSELEQQFERTLGMLLGFESVRLAMMIDDNENPIGSAPAMHSLPDAVNVAGQRIPSFYFDPNVLEPIASLVPNDCYYLRCGSINNYMWLRRFLIGWGGSLDEIITNPTLTTDVRSRIEDQLGLSSDAWQDAEPFVSDMAVIGSDVFFTEGAGIGILLEARVGDEQKLEAILQQQRIDKSKQLGANHHAEMLTNHQVSYFHTPDNRMRSFFVRLGRYLLITNSQAMLTAITSPQATSQSLANLQEYRYALTSNPLRAKAGITIYLSDPFIRRLTSPAYRIELQRRRASAAECRQLEVAAMVAEAFDQNLDSRQALIEHNYLLEDFGIRPDGSHVELQDGTAFDSLRGKAGTFIPVADVSTTTANLLEIAAFSKFANHYRTQWPAVDPVLVSIASSAVDKNIDLVELQIHITPYARNEYQFLTNYLSQPSETHSVVAGNELMGMSARLKSSSREYLAHLGIVDAHVPFGIQQGELQRDGTARTFAERQSFAAVTPSGTDGLQVISGLMHSLQTPNVEVPPATLTPAATQTSPRFNLFSLSRNLAHPTDLAFASGELLVRGLLGIAKLGALYEDGEWSIYGGDANLRQAVRNGLQIQNLNKASQVKFRAGGIDHAEVAPYLNAYSYCQSRKQSAAIATWLNQWSSGLRSAPLDFRGKVEQALQGELMCPLGGQFALDEQSQVWTSTKWEENSLALVDHVPDDYHFPFLQWLKAVELSFNLTPTSLETDVAIQVARTNAADSPSLELQAFSSQQPVRSVIPAPPPAIVPSNAPNSVPAASLSLRITTQTPQALTNVTFSSNGKQVLVGGFDRTAHLLDVRNLNELRILRGHQNVIWTVALSPDGNTAVTGSEDRTLRFWNTRTGQELQRIPADGIYSCARFSPDGNSVLATNWDGKVRIIEMPTFRVKTTIECGQPTLDISVFKSGEQFVVGTPTGEILQYDLRTNQEVKRFVGHIGTVHSVSLFGDGKHFLSASHDHTLRLWDVASGMATAIYRGHTAAVHEVRLAPNERQFVSCSADGTVRLWDIKSGSPLSTNTVGNDVRGISISPNGSSIAAVSMNGTLQLLKLEQLK